MKALSLAHQGATREELLALAKQTPGAWIGIKIATLLLVLEGQRPGRVSALFGLSRMTLERWIHGVNRGGVQALIAKPRPGRPTQLTPAIKQQLAQHLGKAPQEFGLSGAAWDGPTLVVHLKEHFGVEVKVRVWPGGQGHHVCSRAYSFEFPKKGTASPCPPDVRLLP